MNELVLAEAEVSRLLGFCQRDEAWIAHLAKRPKGAHRPDTASHQALMESAERRLAANRTALMTARLRLRDAQREVK